MAKLGKIIGGTIGAVLGSPFGPAGMAAGAAIGGGAGHGADVSSSAARSTKREAQIQGEVTRGNEVRAKKLEVEQRGQREQSLQRLSAERTRSARGRVRGGLFGDASASVSTSLGG